MNKLFFTSVSDGVVYEAELESASGEYHPIPIINVNNPRETLYIFVYNDEIN